MRIEWPAAFPVVRSYLDQLVHGTGLAMERTTAIGAALDAAEQQDGPARRSKGQRFAHRSGLRPHRVAFPCLMFGIVVHTFPSSCEGSSDMDVLQGTLDLLVLKTLAWGPRHGYGVAQWGALRAREVTHERRQRRVT
ncbi:MAG: hypothetical protein ABIP66_09740 [Gemmatimonadaceae bacterium]